MTRYSGHSELIKSNLILIGESEIFLQPYRSPIDYTFRVRLNRLAFVYSELATFQPTNVRSIEYCKKMLPLSITI